MRVEFLSPIISSTTPSHGGQILVLNLTGDALQRLSQMYTNQAMPNFGD